MVHGSMWRRRLPLGEVRRPHPHAKSNCMRGKGTDRDFAPVCPSAPPATTSGSVLLDRWLPPHFAFLTEFSIAAWDAKVEWPGILLFCLACWIQCTDCSRRSSSETVQNIWDVYLQELSFVPTGVRERLRAVRV